MINMEVWTLSLLCLLYSWRENAVSMISGHCGRESMMKSCVFTSILGVGWHFFTWRCRWDLDEKSFSQYLHCFRGAPVWIIMCSFRYHFWEKVFLQSPHSCSAVSSWNLFTCLRKASVLLKVFPHSSHVSTLLLPVWTLRCLAKFAFLNIFPHSSHFFSSCVRMLCWVNLDLDSNVFPHIAQTFSDIVLTWQRLEQNWRYMCQKKVRVVLLSKFSKQKLPSHKTVHFFTDIRFSLGGGVHEDGEMIFANSAVIRLFH